MVVLSAALALAEKPYTAQTTPEDVQRDAAWD